MQYLDAGSNRWCFLAVLYTAVTQPHASVKHGKEGGVVVLLCKIVMGGSRDSLYLNGVTGRFGIHWIGTS